MCLPFFKWFIIITMSPPWELYRHQRVKVGGMFMHVRFEPYVWNEVLLDSFVQAKFNTPVAQYNFRYIGFSTIFDFLNFLMKFRTDDFQTRSDKSYLDFWFSKCSSVIGNWWRSHQTGCVLQMLDGTWSRTRDFSKSLSFIQKKVSEARESINKAECAAREWSIKQGR